jgi:ADP-heptose:LPS heptosyltransferase
MGEFGLVPQSPARPLPDDATILLRVRAFIGDSIFILPALDALRARYPGATIVLATLASAGPLFEGDPRINDFVALAGTGHSALQHVKTLSDYWRLLHTRRFDAHIALDAGGQWLPHLVWASGIPRRVACSGHDPDGKRWHRAPAWMLTDTAPTPDTLGLHRAHGFLNLLSTVGCDPTPRRARLHLTDDDRARGEELLCRSGVPGKPVVAVHPGASWVDRRWPVERLVQVIRTLRERGAFPVALGGPADQSAVAQLAAAGAVPVATGSVRDMARVLSVSQLFIGNDSGPLHVAAACGTPLVGLYGPNLPELVGPDPLHSRARVLIHRLPCSPCPMNVANSTGRCLRPHGLWCMEQVSVEDVLGAAEELLRSPAV